MKDNKITPEQWGLEQCVTHALNALDEETRDYFRENSEYNDEFGRWIRNNCGLWEHGANKCAAEIVQAYLTDQITSKYLDEDTFIHPDLSFDGEIRDDVDSRLTHPDNCSAIIVEQVFKRLHDGR